jgi:hypothetical protein
MDKTSVYQHSFDYAQKNDELELYHASYKANVACKKAIEAAIAEHYYDNRLNAGAVKQVVDQFGYDRMFYVLANTVQQKDDDGRISRDNKEWAKTIPVFKDGDGMGSDRRWYFVVDQCNPGLTDLFLKQARQEYLLSLPLTRQDVEKEAGLILQKLQSEREPNSPGGTHYMARISPDFLIRASTKDHDMLPFQSLSISSLKGRKGLFVFISKDEPRDRPLRLSRQLSERLKGVQRKSTDACKGNDQRKHDTLLR